VFTIAVATSSACSASASGPPIKKLTISSVVEIPRRRAMLSPLVSSYDGGIEPQPDPAANHRRLPEPFITRQ